MKNTHNLSFIIFFLLTAALFYVYWLVFAYGAGGEPKFYFLDVGQGDSELVVFPGGMKIITDAGPDSKIVKSAERVLGEDKYIDLGLITHSQLDHFNGFYYLLDHYNFGAFIINGRTDAAAKSEWDALFAKIKEKNIPVIVLSAGDKIRFEDNSIKIISPGPEFISSGEPNDTGLVELISAPPVRAIFTADTGSNIEDFLIKQKIDLSADILKVGHHGSKYSTSDEFLKAINPKVAVIEVGAKNVYNHPTPETLERLKNASVPVFRTDQDGTVTVTAEADKLRIFKEK